MKDNRSLALTMRIQKELRKDLSSVFYDFFPFDMVDKLKPKGTRSRVFSPVNTLLTMILTMLNDDKSLQNSVNLYSHIHLKNKKRIEAANKQVLEEQKRQTKRKPGRPRKSIGRVAKSKTKEISKSTSAFTQARKRLPLELFEPVFNDSKDFTNIKYPRKKKFNRVFIADGTYLQLQNTKSIREEFYKPSWNSFPRALLESIIEQGSGAVYDYRLLSDKKGELEALSSMIENIPKDSTLLADDLYNCFGIFSLLKSNRIDVVVPAKRKRNYKLIETIGAGDDIVEITNHGKQYQWLEPDRLEHEVLRLRRINYYDIEKDKNRTILTSLSADEYSKSEIIQLYNTRWDIEISIREIKSIMELKVLNSKSTDMIRKELASGIIAYNYIRKSIALATESSAFPPETDILEEYYENIKPTKQDKLGRRYNKWSPGRKGYTKGTK